MEVVNAVNTTTGNLRNEGLLSGKNFVLICDVEYTETQTIIMEGSTIYGNGFKYDFSKFSPQSSDIDHIFVIEMNSATFDNVQLIGKTFTDGAYVYQTDAKSQNMRQNYQSLIVAKGESNILNSFVSGTRTPVRIVDGVLTITNSTISGGNVANIDVKGGTLNINNVTTINQGTDVVGYGIFVDNDGGSDGVDGYNATININGLTSYNWLSHEDVGNMIDTTANAPMTALLNSVFDSEKFEGATYINFAIVCLNDTEGIKINYSKDPVKDTIGGNNGRLWCEIGDIVEAPKYEPNACAPVVPEIAWSDKVTNDTHVITFEKGQTASLPEGLLIAQKFGMALPISVSGETEYTEAGNYVVTYTVTDSYIYDKDGNKTGSSVTYTKKLTIIVSVTEPSTPEPEFVFKDYDGNTYEADIVEGADGRYYVTPKNVNTTYFHKYSTQNSVDIYAVKVRAVTSNKPGTNSSYEILYPVFYGIKIEEKDGTVYNASSVTGSSLPSDFVMTFVGQNEEYMFNGQISSKKWKNYGVTQEAYYQEGTKDPNTQTTDTVTYTGIGLSMYYSNSSTTAIESDTGTKYIYEFTYKGNDEKTYVYYQVFHRPYGVAKTSTNPCVTGDTLVTLADGTQKRIDQVTYADKLLAWDFFKGEFTAVSPAIIFDHGYGQNTVIELNFSDGTTVKAVTLHQFFDATLNKYVTIDAGSVADYVGHKFAKKAGDGYTFVTLTSYTVSEEHIDAWGIISAEHYNIFVEGMLSTDFMHEDFALFNYFEVGENMMFDETKMQADIEKYGLYTYEDFAHVLTYEQFVAFNVQYFKVAVGKGVYTYEGILKLIETYLNP